MAVPHLCGTWTRECAEVGVVVLTTQYGRTTSKLLATVLLIQQIPQFALNIGKLSMLEWNVIKHLPCTLPTWWKRSLGQKNGARHPCMSATLRGCFGLVAKNSSAVAWIVMAPFFRATSNISLLGSTHTGGFVICKSKWILWNPEGDVSSTSSNIHELVILAQGDEALGKVSFGTTMHQMPKMLRPMYCSGL